MEVDAVEKMNQAWSLRYASIRFEYSIWTYILGLDPTLSTLGLSLGCGIGILVICAYINASLRIQYRRDLVCLRVLLAIPASIIFLDVIFAPHTITRSFASGAAPEGLFGLFQTWDICLSSLVDGNIGSVWVRREQSKNPKVANGSSSEEKIKDKDAIIIPRNRADRIKYAVDLVSTFRGVSWFGDRRFDFLAPVIIRAQNTNRSRREFITSRLIHLAIIRLVHDACDTLNKSQVWMRPEELGMLTDKGIVLHPPSYPPFAHQITRQPLSLQASFVLSMGITTQLGVETFYTSLGLICVGLFNTDPAAFPHFFDNPWSLTTNSVRSFWADRWHHIFRHGFDRAVDPWFTVLHVRRHTFLRRMLRTTSAFVLCGLIHCIIQARLQVYHFPPGLLPPILDADTIWFFASQPVAITVEQGVLLPLFDQLPPQMAYVLRRVWTWGWLFWSGRWWADVWVKMGMWQPEERVIFISIIRGLWRGEWYC
ncbi:hypothetical protein CPB86DRAFT_764084 [Serendipita vermifera]|nr:hypothetical protein CPB86DRAFT_764084 [Serendipita vermifera]